MEAMVYKHTPHEGSEKRCSACRCVKPLSHFGNDARSPDGLTSQCKQCTSEYRKSRRKKLASRTPEELRAAMPEQKICYMCKERLPASAFLVRPGASDCLSSECRACRTRDVAERRKANTERMYVEPPDRKRCSKCENTLDRKHFAVCRAEKSGLQAWCKSCAKDYREFRKARKRATDK